MWFGLITLFPEMFKALEYGITGRAIKDQTINLNYWNPRDFALDKHKTVDAKPYGGGPGMIMMTEPLQAALHAAKKAAPTPATTIYLSPQGKKFDQSAAQVMSRKSALIFVAGRYEGIDERIIEQEVDEEWSLGDFILSGGELASMAIIDSISRFVPGVVGDQSSVTNDSLSDGLIKGAQYTRPETFNGESVPATLLSGHHKQIETWRLKEALGKTWLKRPDLLAKRGLSTQEIALLCEFIKEFFSKKA